MPNWCKNKLTILGLEESLNSFVEKAKGRKPKWALDKQEIIYVKNLQERGLETPKHLREDFIPPIQYFCFHSLIPIPEEIIQKGYNGGGYEAEKKLWGVKWGALDSLIVLQEKNRVDYHFNTAWAPPLEFLIKVSKNFPELHFLLSYEEEYPTRGRFTLKEGKSLNSIHEEPNKLNGYISSDEIDDEEAYLLSEKWRNKYYNAHEMWVSHQELTVQVE